MRQNSKKGNSNQSCQIYCRFTFVYKGLSNTPPPPVEAVATSANEQYSDK